MNKAKNKNKTSTKQKQRTQNKKQMRKKINKIVLRHCKNKDGYFCHFIRDISNFFCCKIY